LHFPQLSLIFPSITILYASQLLPCALARPSHFLYNIKAPAQMVKRFAPPSLSQKSIDTTIEQRKLGEEHKKDDDRTSILTGTTAIDSVFRGPTGGGGSSRLARSSWFSTFLNSLRGGSRDDVSRMSHTTNSNPDAPANRTDTGRKASHGCKSPPVILSDDSSHSRNLIPNPFKTGIRASCSHS
jgi:hypothetical protein